MMSLNEVAEVLHKSMEPETPEARETRRFALVWARWAYTNKVLTGILFCEILRFWY